MNDHTIAKLNVSGEQIEVGFSDRKEGAVFINTNGPVAEPIYMSSSEADMLITTLMVAIEEVESLP